jgi:hypothetical protein
MVADVRIGGPGGVGAPRGLAPRAWPRCIADCRALGVAMAWLDFGPALLCPEPKGANRARDYLPRAAGRHLRVGSHPPHRHRRCLDVRRRLGRAFAEDLRLLEDLGWADTIDRETVALTVPPDELARTLARLHKDAAGSLGTYLSRPKDDYIGHRMLDGLVDANEILTIAIGDDSRIELNSWTPGWPIAPSAPSPDSLWSSCIRALMRGELIWVELAPKSSVAPRSLGPPGMTPDSPNTLDIVRLVLGVARVGENDLRAGGKATRSIAPGSTSCRPCSGRLARRDGWHPRPGPAVTARPATPRSYRSG